MDRLIFPQLLGPPSIPQCRFEIHCATVPAAQKMVGVSGELSAWNTKHGTGKVRERWTGAQEKVACPSDPFVFLISEPSE